MGMGFIKFDLDGRGKVDDVEFGPMGRFKRVPEKKPDTGGRQFPRADH